VINLFFFFFFFLLLVFLVCEISCTLTETINSVDCKLVKNRRLSIFNSYIPFPRKFRRPIGVINHVPVYN
jgi:hypothetical protein